MPIELTIAGNQNKAGSTISLTVDAARESNVFLAFARGAEQGDGWAMTGYALKR